MITQLKSLQARREREGEEGFTLIELLIVIVVLGILAAVVVFALGSVTGNAKASACNADSKTIETAVAAYDANPPSGCSTECVIGDELSGTVAGDITPGTNTTYGNGTQAQALISNGDLNSWPQTTNGYSISLATGGTIYLAGAATTLVTAKAGEVILYIPADAASGSGQIYDSETSATGCNAL